MSILVPAALAFAIIIPIILILYLMRPKRQERVVGSTLLWQQALQDLQASRPWQRLRVTPLLLLQLLAAIIIILVLTRPAIFTSSPISGDSIIILQASASMQATDVSPSRFESAKNQVADLINGLGPSDHMSLIAMARVPKVLIAQSQDQGQLSAALQRATVTNQDADLQQALSLATSLVAGRTNIQVLIVGDGHVLPPDQTLVVPFSVHYLRVGTNAPNVALLALASRTVQGKLVALAQVANYSAQPRSIPVELYADGKLVGVQTISLAAGASSGLQWGSLPTTARFLHAQLLSQDAMTVDHEAWAIVGGSIHGRVLLVTSGNSFLQAALRLQSNIDLFKVTPQQYTSGTVGNYDLTVFDGFVPAPPHKLPDGGIFFINPPAGSYLFGKSGTEISVTHISAGKDDINLLNAVDLSSIHSMRASHLLTPQDWAQPIITTPETPLLIAGEQKNQRIAVFGFDLHDTDLPLQPSFPILIFNLVNWFLPPPVPGDGQVPPAMPVSIQTWPGADKVTVVGPRQQTVSGTPPLAPFAQTNDIGIYSVTQHVHGQDRSGAFAVNLFDPLQSRLAPADSLPIANSSNFSPSGNNIPRVLREIWPWIAAFFLLVLCAEWWLFSRGYRRTSQALSAANAANTSKGAPSRGTANNGRISSRSAPASPFTTFQKQVTDQYKMVKKRFVKATKRSKSRPSRVRIHPARSKGKGNTRAKF